MPRFVIHHAKEGSRVFELSGTRPISIGRAKSSTLVLDNESVSRLHAVVHVAPDGRWQVTDRGSANKVRVNGSPVNEAVLRANDDIVIGEYRLRFFEDSAPGNMITYGSTELPQRVASALAGSSYSGTSIGAQALGEAATPLPPRTMPNLEERVRTLENENRLLTVLYRVSRALGELDSVEEVAGRVLDLVLEIGGAERGYAMLLDAASMGRCDFTRGDYGFEPAVIRHRAGGSTAAKMPQNQAPPKLTISQSIIRQTMQSGMPLLITDAQADPRLSASESVAAFGIQSAMCAPLGVKERRFGLLYVDNLSRRGMFTVDDLNVFAVIASQAGLKIDHLRARSEVGRPSPQPTLAGE